MSTRLIEADALLAGRYVVEDMLVEEGAAESWRAFDRVLSRRVVLQVLPSSSPSSARLLDAARLASRVPDPRILQVLDAVDDGALTYVVREWVSGQTLDHLLAEGPLPARRTAWLLRECAGALAAAHRVGVTHGCLIPSQVLLTDAGGVKILGLATLAALRDTCSATTVDSQDLQSLQDADTRALGRLLFACLTARWPGEGCSTLPEAPTVRGHYLRPRQVRAGVARSLDALCDRILLLSPSYRGDGALTTATQVQEALTRLLAGDVSGSGSTVPRSTPPEAVPVRRDHPPATGPATPERSPSGTAGHGSHSKPRRFGASSSVLWAALALIVAAAMVVAYLMDHHTAASLPSSAATPGPTLTRAAPALRQLPVTKVRSFDPYPGSGSENPGQVRRAVDDNPQTSWDTLSYRNNPQLGGLKKGVGLVLDLGHVRTVHEVKVLLQGTPTSLQLRAAPSTSPAPPRRSADQYRLLAGIQDAGTTAVFRLAHPVATQYLLVWLTSLPPQGVNHYRGAVAEVKVFG